MPILEHILIHLRLDINALDPTIFLQCCSIDFVVKVSDVGDDSVMLHGCHVLDADNLSITGSCDVDVNYWQHVLHQNNFVALHAGLECANRVYFGYVNTRPATSECLCAPFANISKPTNKNLLASNHDISGTIESIND